MTAGSDEFGLSEIADLLWRRRWLATGVFVATLAVGLGCVRGLPHRFHAEAKFIAVTRGAKVNIVDPRNPLSGLLPWSVPDSIPTQVTTLREADFQRDAKREVTHRIPGSHRPEIEVNQLEGTQVISVRVTDGDPDYAVALANQLVDLHVRRTRERALEDVSRALRWVRAEERRTRLRAAALDAQLQALASAKAAPAGFPRTPVTAPQIQFAALGREREEIALAHAGYVERLHDLQLREASDGTPVRVLVRAHRLPSEEPTVRRAVVGESLLVGLLLSVFVSLLAEMVDDRLHSGRAAAGATGVPLLGHYRQNGPNTGIGRVEGAYRTLAAALLAPAAGRTGRTLLVCEVRRGERKGIQAALVARVLSESGIRVERFPVPEPVPPRVRWSEWQSDNEVTVIECRLVPPALDAIPAAAWADAIVLVASAGETRKSDLRRVTQALAFAGLPVVGVVYEET